MFQPVKEHINLFITRILLVSFCVLQVALIGLNFHDARAASAPNIISYQGRVLNANGIPVTDTSVNMIYQLYTASSGGTCVWSNSSASCATATARSVTLTDGLFSEPLGDTTASYAAISDAIFGDNATLYLQVTVGGEALSPRKQILAAPYALNADTVDGLDADTDGATATALVALTSAGNVIFTGDPSGATVSTGVVYINPAAAGANETIFGIGDNGTDRLRVDKEGDVFIKTIELDGTGSDNITSGASLIGVFDELAQSNSSTLQDVLDDLDGVLDGIVTGGGASKWTDGGTFTHLSSTTDDIVIGASTVAGASLFFDESAGQLDLGTDSALAGTIRLFSVTAATDDPTLSADASGNLDITTASVELSGDLLITGGDLTSTSATFNLLDAASNSTTLDIGGVTTDLGNTVNIATNATSADFITIGNSHASSTLAMTGGDDWSMAATGVLTMSASAAATTAIIITDTDYTNAFSIGDNVILGTTATINFDNFDVATTGAITVAAGTGLDTNGAGALTVGNTNATSVSVCNSAACDTLTLGTNADADTITIGEANDDVSITDANWSISAAGLITTADDIAVNGDDITSDGTLTINASSTVQLGTDDDWSTTGDATFALSNEEEFIVANGGTANITLSLTSTGDFRVADGALAVFSVFDTGFVKIGSGAGTLSSEGLVIDIGNGTNITAQQRAFLSETFSANVASGTTISTQYANDFSGMVLSGVAGGATETITTVATMHIDAPTNGGDLTITNGPYALFVDSGSTRLDADLIVGGSTSATETLTDGGSGFSQDGDDLFVAGTAGIEGKIFTDSGLDVASGGDITCTDCLTFTDFTDSMSVDAATTIAFSTFNLTHNLDSTGDFVIQDAGASLFTINDDSTVDYATSATTTDAWDVVLNTLTTGIGFDIDLNALTTGRGVDITSASTTLTSGDLFIANHAGTYTANTTLSGNVLDIDRNLNINGAGQTLAVTGSLMTLTNTMTQTAGTLTDTAVLLEIDQNYTSASGHVIDIANAGTGSSIFVDPSGNTGTTVSTTAGGAVHIDNTSNANHGLTVYSNQGSTSASALAFMFNDNADFDVNVQEIRNDSTNVTTSSGLVITQNVVADATTAPTSQALVINVNEAANSDEVILIISDADGTPDAEFRFENDGDLFGDGAAYNAGADYAEFFYTLDQTLGSHQVVCQDLHNNLAVKKCSLGDPTVIGVVSTNPGFVGNNIPGADGSLEGHPNYRVVGLEGQIDTLVTAADGPVKIGDPLTASAVTPGYAGKAKTAGRIVGFAMQPLAAGSGLIKVRISPTWHAGAVLDVNGEISPITSTLALASLSTATAAVPSADSYGLAFRGSAWDGQAAKTLSMSLSNRVSDIDNYRLSVANTDGHEVAYVNNVGDLVLGGKLFPANQGTIQTSAYIYYDNSGLGYMRTNAAGWGTGSYDFAEMFSSPDMLEPGDVVVFGDDAEQVKQSTGQTYDDRIAGVISTRPGFLAGAYTPGASPVALSGRVPTRINTENGPISIGDPLTTSSTPGEAMRASQPGPIVGYALQSWESGSGMISVFVRASYYDGGETDTPAIVTAPISQLGNTSNLTSLNLNGGPITSISSLAGLGSVWYLSELGDLVTRGRLVQIIKSYQNEDVETYAAASLDMTVQLSGTVTLNDNFARVDFEKFNVEFNDVISTLADYRVLTTPSGITGQVYVTDRTTAGFTVRSENAADGVLVDWLVIATHKDYEITNNDQTEESAESILELEPVAELPLVLEPESDDPISPVPDDENPIVTTPEGSETLDIDFESVVTSETTLEPVLEPESTPAPVIQE